MSKCEEYLTKAEYERCRAAFESLPCYGDRLLFKRGGAVFYEDYPSHEYVDSVVQSHWETFRVLWKEARKEAIEEKARVAELETETAALRGQVAALLDALQAASDHLDYVGYGDSWERECAQANGLMEKIETALTKTEATAREYERTNRIEVLEEVAKKCDEVSLANKAVASVMLDKESKTFLTGAVQGAYECAAEARAMKQQGEKHDPI